MIVIMKHTLLLMTKYDTCKYVGLNFDDRGEYLIEDIKK
jgi:hypothetical protein